VTESKRRHPLATARDRCNLTQRVLAGLTGLGLATIQRAEAGKPISAECRRVLCDFFSSRLNRDVSPQELGVIYIDLYEEDVNGTEEETSQYIIIEKEVSEQDAEQYVERDIESEEAVNRREAGKKIAAYIGGVSLSAPRELLRPQRWAQFSKTVRDSSDIENLPQFEKLTEATWHLLKSSDLDVLERVLDSYLPKLEALAELQSKYQAKAAGLTAQAYELKGILASHQLNLNARREYQQQAVQYSVIAKNPDIQASSLIQLASAYQYLNQPIKVLQTYQLATPLIGKASPLLASCIYLGLADASAKCDREQDAHRYLGLAREVFPKHPENDRAFLFSDAGIFSLALYEGLTFLGMDQAEAAWNALAEIEKHPDTATPERVRIEIINLQAEAAIVAGDLERFCDRVEIGRNRAVALGSEKRYQEASDAYKHAKVVWRGEPRLKALAGLFVR